MRKINDGLNRFQRYKLRHPDRVRLTAKKYRKAHPERVRASTMKWRADHPKQWTKIKRRSDLNVRLGQGAFEHFNKQRVLQKNKCSVCERRLKKACSDHNHVTAQWRGILCDNCNRGIGLLGESIKVLLSAVKYLRKWRA